MRETTVPQKAEAQVPETREETRTLVPVVDIFEIEDGLAVVVDLPGVGKEGVDVHVENDILTISGKPAEQPIGTLVYREFGLVKFFRQFQLSDHVDQEKIAADLKNGVLTITLPKAEKAKPKKITVNIAA